MSWRPFFVDYYCFNHWFSNYKLSNKKKSVAKLLGRHCWLLYTHTIIIVLVAGPAHGPQRCWMPMPSNSCTTTAYTSMDGHSSPSSSSLSTANDNDDDDDPPVTAVTLVPVIVPLVSAAAVVGLQVESAANGHQQQQQRWRRRRRRGGRPVSLRRHSSNTSGATCRGVKFDETALWALRYRVCGTH